MSCQRVVFIGSANGWYLTHSLSALLYEVGAQWTKTSLLTDKLLPNPYLAPLPEIHLKRIWDDYHL